MKRKDTISFYTHSVLLSLFIGLFVFLQPTTLYAAQRIELSVNQQKGITLVVKDRTLQQVLKEIEQQTSYVFVYNSKLPGLDEKVTVNIQNATIEQVMDSLLQALPLGYEISGRQVMIVAKASEEIRVVSGRVLDEQGEPLIGVNVKSKQNGTVTDMDGRFTLKAEGTVTFSYVGYKRLSLGLSKCKEVRMVPDHEAL